MNENKLVSILVFSYNNLKYMEDCFKSIFSQDYPNIELVLCDDSSENFDRESITQYIEENKSPNITNYIIYSNEENQGIVKCINNGIKISHGSIIVHTSVTDAFFDTTAISTIVNFHNNSSFDIAVGFVVYYDNELKNQIGWYTPNPKHLPTISGPAIECYNFLVKIGAFFPSPGLSYKRSLIVKYGYYDERYKLLDAYPRFLSLTRRGCKIGFIDKLLIKYRDGIIATNKESNVKSILETEMELAKKIEIADYKPLLEPIKPLKTKDVSKVSLGSNIKFIQKTLLNGDGSVKIGGNCKFYSLSSHSYNLNIIIQARYPDSTISIGNNTILSNNINIIAVKSISIGENCSIGDRVTISDCDVHEIDSKKGYDSIEKYDDVVIGNNVWISTGCVILKGVHIGDNCVIYANSVVTKDIPENSIVGGNPAEIISSVL